MTSEEQERIERELLEYIKILEAKKDKDRELSEESKIPSKPVCLSSLQSPVMSHSEVSEDQKQLLDRVSSLIIEYGRRVLP
jgi:hypothetical protein